MSTRTVNLSVLLVAALAGAAPVQAPSVDGLWRSQGYGYVFEIEGPTLKAFEVTSTTCVPGFTAALDATAVPGREATFKTPDGQVLFIRAGGTADHRLLHNDGSASDVRIDRIP